MQAMKNTQAPPSFDDWFKDQRPKLLRLARSRLGDRAEAEDVVQDTALALWRRLAQGDIDDPDAYAARALWQNALRRRGRRRDWVALDEARHRGAAAEAEAWMDSQAMEAALARLPPTQQAVLRLRFYTGLSFKEMAATLAISLNTAASRCRYALDALRHSLDPLKEEERHGKGPAPRPARPQLRRRQQHRRHRNP
jgi:RNA polymerase sigma-70 factor (ECF subfamily)